MKTGITIGDAAGIGPEICCKIIKKGLRPPFYGYRFILEREFRHLFNENLPGDIEIIEPSEKMDFEIEYGKVSGEYGKACMLFIEKAVNDAQNGIIDAVVTCPINKKSIQLGGYNFPGHTEFLGYLTGTKDFSMMLAGNKVKVIMATTHLPISKVADALNIDNIYSAIRNAHNAGRFFGYDKPRIAVCGLNPHAGDLGALGNEEAEKIIPAIEKALKQEMDVKGPFPADSLFPKVLKGDFDIVVTMYHDQGMIPVKMESFGNAVNITLNLPIIRTSVDHGTAFDIAGKGMADESSLLKAMNTAEEMVKNSK